MYVCVITWFSISILLLFCPSKLNKQFSPNNLTGITPRLFAVSPLLALAVGTWLKKTTLTPPGEDKTAQAGLVLECKHALPVWLSTLERWWSVPGQPMPTVYTRSLSERERERKRGEREKTGRGGGKGKEYKRKERRPERRNCIGNIYVGLSLILTSIRQRIMWYLSLERVAFLTRDSVVVNSTTQRRCL